MKYYVHYTEDCTPKIKEFKNSKLRGAWLLKWFLDNNLEDRGGYWIDLLFEGEITFSADDIED